MRGGAAGYALSIAVEQILGAGVDWVLDPANNRIKYHDLALNPDAPTNQFYWLSVYSLTKSTTYIEAALKMVAETCRLNNYSSCSAPYNFTPVSSDQFGVIQYDFKYDTYNSSGTKTVRNHKTSRYTNPAYNPEAENEDEEKFIPLDVVGQRIIDNANAGDTTAQEATTTAAQDMLANDAATQSDVETQLNTNAKTQTSEEAAAESTPKDPAVPDAGTNIKITFPVFCGWAPLVCEAAQSAIKFPTTVTNWWNTATTSISDAWTWTKARYEAAVTSISDFFKNEPNPDSDNGLPVQDIPLPQLNTGTFKAIAGCPAPIPINITIGTQGTGSISYEPICQFASKWSFVAPLIGFLSAAMILVGVGRKGEDSEI